MGELAVPAIQVRDIHLAYSGVPVLKGLTLEIPRGGITALLGTNGAGKSTLFNVATGFARSYSGEVFIGDQVATGWSPQRVFRAGVARVFQDVRLYRSLTVRENLVVALRHAGRHASTKSSRDTIDAALERGVMSDYAEQRTSDLSFGQQKRVALARAIVTQPSVLLLDEPSAGLDPAAVARFSDMIRAARDDGMTVWIIEHNRDVVSDLADRVAFLADHKIIAEGPTADIVGDEYLARLYLGDRIEETVTGGTTSGT